MKILELLIKINHSDLNLIQNSKKQKLIENKNKKIVINNSIMCF